MIALKIHRAGALCAGVGLLVFSAVAAAGRPFSFGRDTFAFANETALEFHNGHPYPRRETGPDKPKRFTQHCFVMSRSVMQFRKFVRFDPIAPPLDDRQLAVRVRQITSRLPWEVPFAEQDRILIPGYRDLGELSRARPEVLQDNIGLGWPTYFRPGNWRILLPHGPTQQAKTHAKLEQTLSRREFFVAYLTNFPESLNINHGVLVYEKQDDRGKRARASGNLRYSVYDPNHPDGPRTLEWSPGQSCFFYQPDTDFVGGKVVVWQVYGQFLQ